MHISAASRPFARPALVLAVLVAAAMLVTAVLTGSRPAAIPHPTGDARSAAMGDGGEAHVAGEPPIEKIALQSELVSRQFAPFSTAAPGALANAVAQRALLGRRAGTWTPVGSTPLHNDNPAYGLSNLGYPALAGRVTDIEADSTVAGHYFLGAAGGGVWETTDGGQHWRSIGDKLETQVVGAIAYSSATHTIFVGTGDNAFGGDSSSGLGIFTSANDGVTWREAVGIPDGALSFRFALGPHTNGATVYAATSKGLFRSTNGGGSWTNDKVPTGTCAGDVTSNRCFFANMVTDVAVRPTDGAVIAAVGWRAGRALDNDGVTVQAPQNGIYVSPTGAPNSFVFEDPGSTMPTRNGFAPTPVVGRTSLAVAGGPGQNPNIVYALVQDATKLQHCLDVLDVPEACGADATASGVAQGTVLDGAYVSMDFGQHWVKIMDWSDLRAPGNNSSLGVTASVGYNPGIQSWYNNWIAVDPTVTDPLGTPGRVLFGLEEIWENATYPAPVVAPTTWKVIARYWNACGAVLAGTQCNGAGSPMPGNTTHPDQHAAALVPDGLGGVTLLAGSDGGFYRQHQAAGADFNNDSWGPGLNVGLNTLQPYDVSISRDGTVVAGLQDNGEMRIDPSGRRDMIFGGDGFDTVIDPANSQNIAEEYAYAAVSVTSNGGVNWLNVTPARDPAHSIANPLFWAPLVVDPTNANHLVVGGQEIWSTHMGYTAPCFPANTPGCPVVDYVWGTEVVPGTTYVPDYDLGAPNQASALDVRGNTIWVGFCGYCDVLTQKVPFANGIATNLGGTWHKVAAAGLPSRYITSIKSDPTNSNIVYVTLGGYGRKWIPPGATMDQVANIGEGHVFKSTDAGATFADISANLPDIAADSLMVGGGHLLAGTDLGVFISSDLSGTSWAILGSGLPNAPVFQVRQDPANPLRIFAATYGRDIYSITLAVAP
ncbi:MAG TPA: hypothetical protein VJS19_04295 [Candidatus Dormibacteraeota bacterium]|nr:hypothetical protein [Candidatus Dormibacteraeota bacterium]